MNMITGRSGVMTVLGVGVAVGGMPGLAGAGEPREKLPNIVYILCDDLGYGDVKSLNPAGKIATPNMDKLATEGMCFTDMHSGSSVCTPTRYGILTGRYCWRSRLQHGVLDGYSPRLIEPGRMTVASLLKQQGYETACIGKWHLGMDVPKDPARLKVGSGPTTVGFDYFYGITASLDFPPFAFIENDHFTKAPTASKTWVRTGAAAPDFEAEQVLPELTRRAVEYIDARKQAPSPGHPFFLYLPLNSPHTPIVPSKAWQGKSGINPYADFVMQTDASVGEILAALEKNGMTENTLVIVTSDNGCSPAADLVTLNKHGHEPSSVFRGHKADIWDGGHRIPFLCRWPARIQAGSKSDRLACLTDLMATCADIAGVKLPDHAGEDSVSLLPELLGSRQAPVREAVVHHSIDGKFAIRQGPWKLELCPGSGGWGAPKDPDARKQRRPDVQLYNMTRDIGEKDNVQALNAPVVSQLIRLLEKFVAEGRSTPGAAQTNAVPVDIWKRASRVHDGADSKTPGQKHKTIKALRNNNINICNILNISKL